VVQRVGAAAQQWQERPAQPAQFERGDIPILYVSADGTGIPMVPEELAGRKGKQADGKAKTRQECAGQPQAQAVEEALHYFVTNISRMQCGTFRAADYFIGSGVVEAGCKTVIGGRCKQSGMFWSEPGAENILAFRCIHSSGRLDQFWKHRLNAKVAKNDCLPLAA
jgi:hypothetical protein